MDNSLVLLVLALVGVGVGYLIGQAKNRPVLGALLGFFLGIIGWIIIAVIPKKK